MKVVQKIVSITLAFVLLFSLSVPAFAVSDDEVSVSEVSAEIEDLLSESGTSTLDELYEAREEYQELQAAETDSSEAAKYDSLIAGVDKMIDGYIAANANAEGSTADSASPASTSDELYEQYLSCVSTVYAYFWVNGYKLAAELLSYACDNNSTKTVYVPTNGASRAKTSSVVSSIANGKSVSGSSTFSKGSTTASKDLYYAIHKFKWTKSSSSSKKVVIKDTYDYDTGDYTGVAGVTVGVMAVAQDYGVITPYTVKITVTMS